MRASSNVIPAAGRPRAVSRTWVVRRPAMRSARPLYCALDQAVRLARGVEDLVVVLHPERLEVEEQMVLVREREVDPLYLGELFEHRLAYAVERALHRGAVVIGEGSEDPVPHPAPETVEVEVRATGVGPARGDDGCEDAVVGIWQGCKSLPVEVLPARLRGLQNEEVVEPGPHTAVAALVACDLCLPLAGATHEG